MRQTTDDTTITDLPGPHCGGDLARLLRQHNSAPVIRSTPWPFHAADAPPLAWWRMLPADKFRDAEHLLLRATLDKVAVLRGKSWIAALRGDAAASIAVALSLMPIGTATLEVDIAMTAVLASALDGDAATALMLSHVLGRAALDHPFATELAASWLAHNLRHSLDRRRFSQAEAALWKALRAFDATSATHVGDRV